jgi:hypothetical protein
MATTHENGWAISAQRLLTLLERSPAAEQAMLEHVRQRFN